jgi:hypothetical protein
MDTRLSLLLTNHLGTDSERTARRPANLAVQNTSKMTLFSFASMVAFFGGYATAYEQWVANHITVLPTQQGGGL